MFIKTILFFIDMNKWLFKLSGVDYKKLRLIINIKLINDNRRTYVLKNMNSKEGSNNFFFSLLLNCFFGLLFGLAIFFLKSVFLVMTFIVTFLMIMVALILVSDFTSVLFDTKDNEILLPKPVDSSTLAMSRIVHIFIYMFLLSISLSFFSIIFSFVKYGAFFAVSYMFLLIFATIFIVSVVNLFYFTLMKTISAEKFKEIILYIQIFMVVFFISVYYTSILFTKNLDLTKIHFNLGIWTYFYPPAWYGSVLNAIFTENFNLFSIIHLVLAIFVPILGIFIVVKYLAPGFSKRLLAMTNNNNKVLKKPKSIFQKDLSVIFKNVFAKSTLERITFETMWKMTGRDRNYKLKTYPSFAMIILFSGYYMLSGYKSLNEALILLPESKKYLIILYFAGSFLPLSLFQLTFSENFKASWIYDALPLKKPGIILSGAIKAVTVKTSFVYIIISIIPLIIWRVTVVPHIVFAFINLIFINGILGFFILKDYPFSLDTSLMKDSGIQFKSLISTLSAGALGLLHFGLTFIPNGVYFGIVIMFFVTLLIFHIHKKRIV